MLDSIAALPRARGVLWCENAHHGKRRLAEERSIVLLDAGGFDAPRMSVRVSLADLPDEACEPIGLLADDHARWGAKR